MSAVEERLISLPAEQAAYIDARAADGTFASASEVIGAGLHALADRPKREDADLAEIRDRIARSLDQLDRGDHAKGTPEQVFDRAFARARERQET